MKLVEKETGRELKVGDKVTDFRGEKFTLRGVWEPETSAGGMNGKVTVQHASTREMTFYCSVVGAEFVE